MFCSPKRIGVFSVVFYSEIVLLNKGGNNILTVSQDFEA
jgi:hypothetical protein